MPDFVREAALSGAYVMGAASRKHHECKWADMADPAQQALVTRVIADLVHLSAHKNWDFYELLTMGMEVHAREVATPFLEVK